MTRSDGFLLLLTVIWVSQASAQSASLLHRRLPHRGVGYTTESVSLIKLPPPTPLKVHDLLTVVVDERILQQTNGRVNRRKETGYEVTFDSLIALLDGWRIRNDQAIAADKPKIDIQALNDLRNTIQSNRQDRLQYTIQAEVAEIKPNGNLVIEAHGTVSANNEVNNYRLSGIVNPQDIDMFKRTISSQKIANKMAELRQIGPANDTLKRGWLTRVIDMFSIF